MVLAILESYRLLVMYTSIITPVLPNIAADFSQCTDSVEVESNFPHFYSRCGVANVPDFISTSGTLLVQFASSRSCESTGYAMWANCVPLRVEDDLRTRYMQLNTLVSEVA